jgi:hypothetical protein
MSRVNQNLDVNPLKGGKNMSIKLWIPIDENCNVVFDEIRTVPEDPDLQEPHEGTKKWPHEKVQVHATRCISVTKVEKNPFCWWVEQDGRMVEK